jgi:phage terminase large subunit-like protein
MLRNSRHSHTVRVIESKKEIRVPQWGISYRCISADATQAHGIGARIVFADEWGQIVGHRDRLHEALKTSRGSYKDSLMIVLSTQAGDDADLLSTMIDDALTGVDPRTVIEFHSAPAGCDIMDREAWKAANPALGVFRDFDDVEQMAQEARRIPSLEPAFRQYILNQRVSSEAQWLTRTLWDSCSAPPDEDVLRAGPCYGGLDLSMISDLTSFVLCAEGPGKTVPVKAWHWMPEARVAARDVEDSPGRMRYLEWVEAGYITTTPGEVVEYEHVAADLAEIQEEYPRIELINFDRWKYRYLQREFDKIGLWLPCEPYGMGFKDMDPAVNAVEAAIKSRQLQHGGNPVLAAGVLNARTESDPVNNRKLSKKKSPARIDSAVALCMAVAALRCRYEEAGLDSGVMFV